MMITNSKGKIVLHRYKKQKDSQLTRESILHNKKYDELLITLPTNDYGNAKRFLLFCSDYIKYDKSRNQWMFWNGRFWNSDSMEEIRKFAQTVICRYEIAINECKKLNIQEKTTLRTHARNSNNLDKINSMLKTARDWNYVKELQCKPYLLNVKNGVVNLKTKELYPHDSSYGCTTICNVDYNPKAESTRFKQFLNEVFQGEKTIIKYVQTMFGYAITGEHQEEKLFFLYGQGANGKSKLVDTICYVAGNNAGKFPINALTKSASYTGRPTPELIPLQGKRIGFSSELQGEDCLNDSTIKQLTGNESVSMRRMREEYVNAPIDFTLFIDTNYMPYFKHYDFAIERRVVIIPFLKTFQEGERDLELSQKLKADKEYVLTWLVKGANRYYQEGLKEPEQITACKFEFKRSCDSVGCFIEDVILHSLGEKVQSSVLYEYYKDYCYAHEFKELGTKEFSQEMVKRNLRRKSYNKGNYFIDITIK